MEALKLDFSTARKLFKDVPEWFKEVLWNTFGDEIKGTIFDRVKTFEDACKEIGVKPESLFTEKDTLDEKAYKKLKIIIQVINEGWEPNWEDTNEIKWYPWFKARPSGFGFSLSLCDRWCTFTHCGSRLCLSSKEKAEYVGKQFEDIYNDFLTINHQ